MPYNGSGTYGAPSLPGTWNPASSGSVIDPTDWNTLLADFVASYSTAICKDGQTTITADLPMANHKHTGVTNATARTNYAAAGQIADNALTYAADSGSGTAYVITLAPAITAYLVGQRFTFKAANVSTTTTPTLAVNGLTAGTITWPNGSALAAGDIPANGLVEVVVATVTTGTPTYHLQSYMGRWRIFGVQTPSAVATLDFTSVPTTVNHMMVEYDVSPVTTAVTLNMQVYGTGGVLDTGANYVFANWGWNSGATSGATGATATSSINLGFDGTNKVHNSASFGISGRIDFQNIQAARSTKFVYSSVFLDSVSGNTLIASSGAGWHQVNANITGFRLAFSSGNISVGKVTLYVSE